jgi:hypothetical protein
MKRCPQCEFIYEDDQSLCDMDGVLLVFDSRTLPNLHALATVPATPAPTAAQRRNRAVPAFATLILALVLGMVYYVSTRQTRPPVSTPSTLSTVPVVIPTPEPQPTQSVEPEQVKEEEPKPAPVKQSTAAPAKKSVMTKTTAVSQTKPAAEPKKEDSKVNSFLKKTGRILKKPFKF